mmetsp:Transcript_21535/g.19102  ORF Transcript_21535/g.19102 Transcript_21535/m.19102 type:complete len:95 (+) Transcript_21535:310-594(+)
MFWHTSVQYYTIIDPVKQREVMLRKYYRPRYDRENQYNNGYGAYQEQRGFHQGRRTNRGRHYTPHEDTQYADIQHGRTDIDKNHQKDGLAMNKP